MVLRLLVTSFLNPGPVVYDLSFLEGLHGAHRVRSGRSRWSLCRRQHTCVTLSLSCSQASIWVPRAHLAPILPWSSGPSGHRSPSCEKGHRAKFLLDNGSRKESRWPDGQMANYVQMTFEGDPFLFPKPSPLPPLPPTGLGKKQKKHDAGV